MIDTTYNRLLTILKLLVKSKVKFQKLTLFSSFLGPRFALDLQAFFRDFSDKRGYTLHLGVATPGVIMTEFIALRPKLYSYKVLSGAESKKCKGIKKCVVKKTLTFEDYKSCLFNSNTIYRSQLMFRSMKHDIFTIEFNKVALNRDDDKRISKKDGISTLARGHKSLSWSPILGQVLLR